MNIEKIIQSVTKRTPQPIKPYNYYSVMVPLIQKDGDFSVLFEVRSDTLVMQPGEVCFPGGETRRWGKPRRMCNPRNMRRALHHAR